MRTGNKRIKIKEKQRKPAALKCAQGKGVDQLVDFPFPCAVSSSSLLVQVPQVDEESQKHENQVELQSVGEA